MAIFYLMFSALWLIAALFFAVTQPGREVALDFVIMSGICMVLSKQHRK